MKFVFLDDSNRAGDDAVPRSDLGPLNAYGAVAFPPESLQPYSERLAALREELGLPPGTEFKWAPDPGPLRGEFGKLKIARNRMLEDAAELKAKAVVVVCAPELMPASWDEKKIKSAMLTYLYERITYSLAPEAASQPSTQIGRRPPPVAAEIFPTTVRFSPEEAAEVDQFVLDLRVETVERLDKAELVRELLRLARYHPQTRKTLVKRLRN